MDLLSGSGLKKSFFGGALFENVSFHVYDTDKTGFIGVSGAGKSTLFKMIAGAMEYDGGEIVKSRETRIGYLEQYAVSDGNLSIMDELLTVFSEVIEIEKQLENIHSELENKSGDVDALIAEQAGFFIFLYRHFPRLPWRLMEQYFSFQWHITDDCDQRCKHCYIFSEKNCKALDSMSFEQMEDTLSCIEDFCGIYHHQPYLYLTGGDPILHPDFWKLMGLFRKKAIPFTIIGNPFHLTDEVCRRLKECGCVWYQLSIDEVPDVIDAVAAAGANVYAFARYCPTSGEKDTDIEPLRYRQLLETCDKKFKEYEAAGCQTYFNKKDHLWTLYEYETGEFQIPADAKEGVIYGGCNCGNCHITILPNGDVYACRRVRNGKVANVSTDRLAADALGVGSCYIGQGWTAFADPYGQEILQKWEIPGV